MFEPDNHAAEESQTPRARPRFHLHTMRDQYVLMSSRLPHWRCAGSSVESVLRDCACSLRSYAENVKSITAEEATFIAEVLTVRIASTFDQTIRWF